MRHRELDGELIRRMVELDAARTLDDARRSLRSDGDDVDVARFGDALAIRAKDRPNLGFLNRVVGFSYADLGHLDAILARYAETGAPCQLDLTPNHLVPELMEACRARGFYHHGHLTYLHAIPERLAPPDGAITIERVSLENLGLALPLLADGGEPFDPERVRRKAPLIVDDARFHLFLARLDGRPAALTSMRLERGTAHLAGSRTLPALRRRGCQTALVAHAVTRASELGADLVVTDVHFGTSSHRNTERLGFRIAYQTAWWVKPTTIVGRIESA